MSTRATYQFSSKYETTATVYVHCDGYPEGTASYFYRLLCYPHRRGCMATRMIRAVDRAELTGEHAMHGDTEYRYNVEGVGPAAVVEMLARKHGFGTSERPRWEPEFVGPLAYFVDKYIDAEWVIDIGGYRPFKAIDFGNGSPRWYNGTTALQEINENAGPERGTSALPCLRMWAAKKVMTANAGNWKGVSDRVRKLAEAFELQDVLDEVDQLTLSVTPPDDCTCYSLAAGHCEACTSKGGGA